jgi:hypothetical protein
MRKQHETQDTYSYSIATLAARVGEKISGVTVSYDEFCDTEDDGCIAYRFETDTHVTHVEYHPDMRAIVVDCTTRSLFEAVNKICHELSC